MLQREIVGLPITTYPAEKWALVETEFSPRYLAETESIFAISNGYLGTRAVADEGTPVVEDGTFINGFHETWLIEHAEAAYGFAKTGQTLVRGPDARRFHLYVDDEPLDLLHADLRRFERRLDFRTGQLTRDLVWRLASGVLVRVTSAAFFSYTHRHLLVVRYGVELLEGDAPLTISSQLVMPGSVRRETVDPRKARALRGDTLRCALSWAQDHRGVVGYEVASSGMTLAAGIDHEVTGDGIVEVSTDATEERVRLVVTSEGGAGRRVELTKYAAFHTARRPDVVERLADRCERTLDRALREGFDEAAEGQRRWLAAFWDDADVEIGGNETVQQAARWSMFQIAQAAVRVDEASIPAKGLTGSAYEGHYFWDTEIYVLPLLQYTRPDIARTILRHRHRMLDKARLRARELSQDGALFPWRTINGEEASAYYAAGTAQFHINADVAYALKKYVQVTGDGHFLAEVGAEMLVETARLWADLGFFGSDVFHIHGVTGPDEYTTVVDDNAYTNLLAQGHLWYAAEVVEWLEKERPEDYGRLVRRTSVMPDEVEQWRAAARAMYIPYDEATGITPQDATFLTHEVWDFHHTPRDTYPLLLHYHPLVIYRHQVIKQADVVLAMFLRDECFDADLARRNFAYYDPLTTGDSSLSTSIQSIVATRIDNPQKAIEYFRYGVFMDLANVAGNTGDGVHIAAAGGVWMSIVYGFGGLRDTGPRLHFAPRLPSSWEHLRFRLRYRDRKLAISVDRHHATYELVAGEPVDIDHEGERITLKEGEPVTTLWGHSHAG